MAAALLGEAVGRAPISIPTALPTLKNTPSESVSSGHYFQSIEMSEGQEVTKSVIDILGEDILLYASDYPHGESWFPISVGHSDGVGRYSGEREEEAILGQCSAVLRRDSSG